MQCKVRLGPAATSSPEAIGRLIQVAEGSCINLATLRHGVTVVTDFETVG
jgi:hypothetical protein